MFFLTWHSYIPWSLLWTNFIWHVHVFDPGVWRTANLSSFVYICAPDDKICQSRRLIQDIWFCNTKYKEKRKKWKIYIKNLKPKWLGYYINLFFFYLQDTNVFVSYLHLHYVCVYSFIHFICFSLSLLYIYMSIIVTLLEIDGT